MVDGRPPVWYSIFAPARERKKDVFFVMMLSQGESAPIAKKASFDVFRFGSMQHFHRIL
jgi:hypothetical protein